MHAELAPVGSHTIVSCFLNAMFRIHIPGQCQTKQLHGTRPERLLTFHVSVVNRDPSCCCPFPPSNKLSAAVTTDVMAVKAAIQGNLQRDRGLRAVMETSLGLLILVVLSPRLAWIFGMVIPLTAWGLVRGEYRGFHSD